MRAVGIKTLKNKLSEYLRLVATGEVVLVVDRDQVVAELRPPNERRATDVGDVRLANLVRSGLLRPALVRGGKPPPGLPVAPLATILDDLARDREDR